MQTSRSQARLIPLLSAVLIVLTSFWGVMLAKQDAERKRLSDETLDGLAAAASEESGVDHWLIRAVIRAESAGRPDAVSRVGACGLMQLMPGTAGDMLRKLKLPKTTDWKEPSVNVRLGAAYLAEMSRMFNGDLDKMLAAYNGGPGNVRKWVRKATQEKTPDRWLENGFKETRSYVVTVKRYHRQFVDADAARKEAERQKANAEKAKTEADAPGVR